MTGFTNSDGSTLVGGQLPSTTGKSLQLDSSGNLLTALGAQSPTNPVITEMNIQNWIRAGNGFMVTCGAQSNAAQGNYAMHFMNPSSAKNILIFSILLKTASGNVFTLQSVTATPTLAGATGSTFYNLANSSSITNLATSQFSTTAGIPAGGTTIDIAYLPTQGQEREMLTNGAEILLPSGATNGLLMFTFANANVTWTATIKYIQF